MAEALECSLNELLSTLVLSRYEQKAACLFLSLGMKNIYLGPALPAFISSNLLEYPVEDFSITPISESSRDLDKILKR